MIPRVKTWRYRLYSLGVVTFEVEVQAPTKVLARLALHDTVIQRNGSLIKFWKAMQIADKVTWGVVRS